MDFGVIALFDILGYDQLLDKYSAQEILNQQKILKKAFVEYIDFKSSFLEKDRPKFFPPANDPNIVAFSTSEKTVKFFSDTVLITSKIPELPAEISNIEGIPKVHKDNREIFRKWYFLRDLIMSIGNFINCSLTTKIPFLYRGCLSLGEFVVDEDFIIGPAIKEAAKFYEKAEAAVVWLTPSARCVAPRKSLLSWQPPYVLETKIPMKENTIIDTFAIDNFALATKNVDHLMCNYLDCFKSEQMEKSVKLKLKNSVEIFSKRYEQINQL